MPVASGIRRTVAVALLCIPGAACAVTSEIRDFLIQNVCVDALDRPVAGDPYGCPRHRDLRIGEKVPYLRVDREAPVNPDVGFHYQAIMAFPVRSPNAADANTRVVVSKEFGGDDPHTAFNDNDQCINGSCQTIWRDGYDVIEMNGTYVAITGTSDPGINHQTFWRKGCVAGSKNPTGNEDAWILFPADLTRGAQGNLTHYLNITTNDTCPSVFNAAHVAWDYLAQPLTYSSGKTMDTITSHHFNGPSSSNAVSFEKFYFTKQYGFTRWEAWQRDDQCGLLGCRPKAHGCHGSTSENVGGRVFIRTDCRDTTEVKALPYPVEPTLFAAPAQLSKTRNFVRYGTFANQLFGLGTWNFAGLQTVTRWSFRDDQHNDATALAKNVSLMLSCSPYCSQNRAYQDVDVTSLRYTGTQTLRFGAAVKTASAASMSIVVRIYDSRGFQLATRSLALKPTTSFRAYEGSFTWNFTGYPATRMRIELVPLTANVNYHVDDVFLSAR
jgi:hypothetical protein